MFPLHCEPVILTWKDNASGHSHVPGIQYERALDSALHPASVPTLVPVGYFPST